MKNKMTELVFILDRSGSMAGLESDTVGGFNSVLEKNRKLDGGCRITTVLFDHEIKLLHDRVDIQQVEPMKLSDFEPRGMTALCDATGMTIERMVNLIRKSDEANRPDNVMFVIITDGAENASSKYSRTSVRKLIERQRIVYDWQFLFLGANIDAEEAAESIGISREFAATYDCEEGGTSVNFDTVCLAAQSMREEGCISTEALAPVREHTEKVRRKRMFGSNR